LIAKHKNKHLSFLLVTGNTPGNPEDRCASYHKFSVCQTPHHIPATPYQKIITLFKRCGCYSCRTLRNIWDPGDGTFDIVRECWLSHSIYDCVL